MRRVWWLWGIGFGFAFGGCGGLTASDDGGGGKKSTGGAMAGGASSGGKPSGGTSSGGTASGGTASGGAGGTLAACGPMPEPTADCGTLREVECVAAHPRCIAMYDDSCCPMCNPTGLCADCARYEFHACVPFDEGGCNTNQPQACGVVSATGCQGEYNLDCLQLSKTSCEANPGCVWALKSGCTTVEGCEGLCRGVTQFACDRPCGVPAPVCPEGYAPEGSGGTYMMDCVPKAMCP